MILGQENLHENGDPNKQKISINQVFKHPNFNYISHEFDIALVKLEDTFEFNDFVAPVILNNEVIPNGVYCTATGWGFQAEDDVLLASTLQKVVWVDN